MLILLHNSKRIKAEYPYCANVRNVLALELILVGKDKRKEESRVFSREICDSLINNESMVEAIIDECAYATSNGRYNFCPSRILKLFRKPQYVIEILCKMTGGDSVCDFRCCVQLSNCWDSHCIYRSKKIKNPTTLGD